MKILMLNYEFPPLGGGAANANYYLLKEFAKDKNIKIDLITSSPGKFKVEQFSDNIRIFKLDVNKKEKHYWKMKEILKWFLKANKLSKKLIRKYDYDLCHCWFGWPSGIIGYLNRRKLHYIIALRGSDVPGHNKKFKYLDPLLFKPISKIVWTKAKIIIANSEGLKKLALKTLKRRINIVYNGVDTIKFRPAKNKKNKKTTNLVSTGRLNKIKGYNFLINAMKGIKNIDLTIIGNGPEKKRLELQACKLNVKVKFLGERTNDEIANLLPKHDIFILTSQNEGMSNSTLEAMACGLPIITTKVGGSKELIKQNGYLVETKNVKSIHYAIKKILKKDIKKLGFVSAKLAKTFSWKNICKEYIEIYKNVRN
ncbi:glycosyltransferase family 4 protein [Candidatus Woesearchaeota archaeon]|nr:glycosyltransferase family 4 protein [Candidatus Woesearchaeota archaeon]MCF8012929.1 glycosyltransferase family 4 protein [Candidatus Woesearchaeota archaeon]